MSAAAWTDLGAGVRVRQSARYAMNSVVLLDDAHSVIVDPGILPGELDDIAAAVAAVKPVAVTLVFTHAHWDHVLGRPWWPAAETLAHDAFAAELRADRDHIRAEAQRLAAEAGAAWAAPFQPFRPDHAVSGLHFRKLGRWSVVLRSAPGHCPSQLNLHLPRERVLVASDMLSDIEIPGLDDVPRVYRDSLEALLPIAEGGAIETLVPGHGSIALGREAVLARLRADLDYLDAIERGARAAWTRGLSADAAADTLASMEYPGKHATEYPTAEIHRENVGWAYRAFAAPRTDRGPGTAG